MKKLLAFALLSLSAISASAATCAVLDYAEMKEMPIEDLRQEYCKASEKWRDNAGLDEITGRRPPGSLLQFEACGNQMDRIWRVLVTKGDDRSMRIEKKYCNGK